MIARAWAWILSSGSVALVFLATAAGAVLANLYAGSRTHRSRARLIAVAVVSSAVALGIVLRDETRRSDKQRKRERLGSRIVNGFSHGFAWRGAGDALELFADMIFVD